MKWSFEFIEQEIEQEIEQTEQIIRLNIFCGGDKEENAYFFSGVQTRAVG